MQCFSVPWETPATSLVRYGDPMICQRTACRDELEIAHRLLDLLWNRHLCPGKLLP